MADVSPSPETAIDFPHAIAEHEWVFFSHNNIRWPDGRRTAYYIGNQTRDVYTSEDNTPGPKPRHLFTMFAELALRFTNRKTAVAWLKQQPHDYGRVALISGHTLRKHWTEALKPPEDMNPQ